MSHFINRHIGSCPDAASLPLGFDLGQLLVRIRAAALVAALMATIVSQASQAQAEPQPAIYDQPLATTRQAVKSDLVESGGGLICYSYKQFSVKRLDSGSPTGDVTVAVVPGDEGPHPRTCTVQKMPGEVSIKGDGFYFVGSKGNFLVMSAADPNGAMPFKVYDRRTASLRYADSTDDHGLKFIADESDTLHIRYRRGVNIICSIPKDGQDCWAKAAREAHLPIAVAGLPAPVAACNGVYMQQRVALDDPSIIVYEVDLAVAPQGGAHVLSRGPVLCEPLP